MPIYEFHCNKCNNNFEQIIMSGDKPVCLNCQTNDVRRLLSVCGFVSKSSGGETISSSAGTSSCASCTSSSCSTCGV